MPGFVVLGVTKPEEPKPWDASNYDWLSSMANNFRENKDSIGVHLCAVVYEEMRAVDLGQRKCRCLGRFYLALAWNRSCDGADHELAHLLLPQIQDLMREADHEARMEQLKAEVADVELDEIEDSPVAP